MDTIAINANEALNEDGQSKKKNKVSDTAKAAMATGAAGIAVGVGAMAAADAMGAESDENADAVADAASSDAEEVPAESGIEEDAVAEVNPDDVMIEDPVAEPTAETDMIAETAQPSDEANPYQPFASNDSISEDVLPDPQPDEVLIAENTEVDVIAGEDPTVDMICGVPEENPGMPDEAAAPDDVIYADNGSAYDESDIQSDLMA